MPYCSKCGAQISEQVAYCPQCGQPQGSSQGAAPAAGGTQSGLAENVAGLLCYAVGWITGIIFYLIDKRPYVRFHAAQSMVAFGALHVLRVVLAVSFGMSWMFGGPVGGTSFSAGVALLSVIGLLSLVLWIVCMIKAYQGERFKLPIAGDIAENLAAK